MAADRLGRILAELSASPGALPATRLCELSRDVVGMSGAAIVLMSHDIPQGSVCITDEISGVIEDLQHMLGEGPCVDAYQQGRVVLEPDLADPRTPRWFAFTPAAVDAGVRAVFAFPVRQGAVRLGAINLYRDRPGPLSDDQHADGLAMADVVARWVLDIQADAPPGVLATEFESGGDFHFIVHNAAGMVSVQAGVSVTEALVRLRAFAFGNDRVLRHAAQEVVDGTLRFD